jgi:transcriptional regulator with XRE-family HTH domain
MPQAFHRTLPELVALALERIEDDNAQEILAERAGVSQSTISKYLAAERRPRPETWDRIARALEVTPDELALAIKETTLRKPPSLPEMLAQVTLELEATRRQLAEARREVERLRKRAKTDGRR